MAYHIYYLSAIFLLSAAAGFLYFKYKKSNQKFESNVKERTMALNTTVKALQQSEKDLRKALQEKDVLLREIHHRVKNNLTILCSLIKLQQNTLKKDMNPDAILEDIKQRILSISKIHTMLYHAHSFAEINFSNYIKSITGEMAYTFKTESRDIKVTLELEPIILNIDTAIPCGLIVNELFSNSFKHAFPGRDSGNIKITFKRIGQAKILSHSDDGVGMPNNLISSDIKSLGLKLIKILTNQIQGILEYENKNGSHFTITFY